MGPLGNTDSSGDSGGIARLPFRRVGAYEIHGLTGRGGTASVYRGKDLRDGEPVAVKVLHAHLAGDEVATARFHRAARATSRIKHPNVVPVLEVGTHQGVPYLAMPFVDGDDLADYLPLAHPMPLAGIAECMLPVIDAIAAAHAAGIVHRDLKPRNIRVARDQLGGLAPKVLDFGVSKWMEPGAPADLTATGECLGTVSYMAPEQLRSARQVDALADVYSLGVILYECATGRRPFQGMHAYDVMHKVFTEAVSPPSFHRDDIPPEFDALVLRAMHREASQRFQSARDLRHALATFESHVDTRGQTISGVVPIKYGSHRKSSVACRMIRAGELGIAVWLHTALDPSAAEWNDGCDLVADFVRAKGGDLGSYRGFVVTDGGSPSTIQRKQLFMDVYNGHRHKLAVVTPILRSSLVKRGIATAIQWLNPGTRFFEPEDVRHALAHIDVSDHHIGSLWTALVSMQSVLPPNKTLRVLADALGLAIVA